MKAQNRTLISVDLDWGSSGLWIYETARKGWSNLSYNYLALPDWMVGRFAFWTDWHNRKIPENYQMTSDEVEMFIAYQLSLALDLRRFLDQSHPGKYEVRCGRERVVEVPDDAKDPPPGPYY
jgi:hypothetical protein